MTDYQKLLYKYMKEHKITIKNVSDLTGICYELLRRSLKEKRVLPTNEFVEILKKLDIDIADLEEINPTKTLKDFTKIVVETDNANPVTIAEITAESTSVENGYRVRLTPNYV